MKESGVPFVYSTWYGLLAPAGTPKAIIAKLNHAVVHALNEPKLHDKLVTTGLDPQPDTPEDFRQIIQSDIEKWRKVIDEAGITKRG
jgi:tripartite-type tricarboxylate transporter receptor subunit TctC